MAAPSGPAALGTGTWPRMSFTGVEDRELRAACEFVQDVVAAVLEQITPTSDLSHVPSRRRLAAELQMDPGTIFDILRGRQWPRTDRLVRLATHVGVTVGVV